MTCCGTAVEDDEGGLGGWEVSDDFVPCLAWLGDSGYVEGGCSFCHVWVILGF